MGSKSKADVEYASALIQTNNVNSSLFIVDARPQINATANRGYSPFPSPLTLPSFFLFPDLFPAAGGGSENVDHYPPNTSLKFLNIDNIHLVRKSYRQLKEVCVEGEAEKHSGQFLTAVDATQVCLFYVSLIFNHVILTFNNFVFPSFLQWLNHIARILAGAMFIIEMIVAGSNVLVHCRYLRSFFLSFIFLWFANFFFFF